MKKYLLFSILSAILYQGFSQHEADHWICAGVDSYVIFTDTGIVQSPFPMDYTFQIDIMVSNTSASSVSTHDGSLLLYMNGRVVYNGQFDTIPGSEFFPAIYPEDHGANNGTGQSLIFPDPGNDNKFYVASIDLIGNIAKIKRVDVSANNGDGAIDPLYYFTAYPNGIPTQYPWYDHYFTHQPEMKIAATYHANGHDVWLITHDYNNNIFRSYLITPNGIPDSAVVSAVGLIHTPMVPPADMYNAEYWGNMRIAPGGNKLAVSHNGLNAVEVFDFDKATGILSNPRQINITRPFSVAFSSNGTMLYFAQQSTLSSSQGGGIKRVMIHSRYIRPIYSNR